jgi:hypothetical protein
VNVGEDVARKDLRFPKRELRERWRVGDIGAVWIAKRDMRVVAQGPDVLLAAHAHETIDDDPAALHRHRERLQQR